MNKPLFLVATFITILILGCSDNDITPTTTEEFSFDFQNDTQSWEEGFADYPVGEEDFYELNYKFSALPKPLNTSEFSLLQTGNNHSDDLFMFIRKQIDNLTPNTNYMLSFEIEFASNVADHQDGVGGSPGEGVTIKAGATSIKPEKVIVESDYKMNIDKGNQSIGGSDMLVIGDFSNDTNENEYTLKTLIANNILTVTTNNQGNLWLIIGTDSGFEATTTIYYNLIKVKLEKL